MGLGTPSGHFVQISGPLWDPLHYVYTCTAGLVRAARKPLPEMPGLYVLPEALKARFHPVIELTSYDTLNERTAQQRTENYLHPLFGSAIDAVPLATQVASLGYHVLPWALEYELDPAHVPNLSPRHRLSPCPPHLQEHLAPQAVLAEDADTYLRYHVVVTEPQRAALNDAVISKLEDHACDKKSILLPQQWQAAAQLTTHAVPAWLPEVAASQLAINIKRLFAARTYRQGLQQAALAVSQPQLPAAFFQFREAALAWRRLRYRLFTKYPATWQQACAEGLNLATAEQLVANHTAEDHTSVRRARAHLLGVVPVSPTTGSILPAAAAGGLPSASSQANVKGGKRQTGQHPARNPRRPRPTSPTTGKDT